MVLSGLQRTDTDARRANDGPESEAARQRQRGYQHCWCAQTFNEVRAWVLYAAAEATASTSWSNDVFSVLVVVARARAC